MKDSADKFIFVYGRVALILSVGVALLLVVQAVADRPIGSGSRSQPTACTANLKALEGAKAYFAQEHGKTNGEPVSMADLGAYLGEKNLRYYRTCPYGGHYELQTIGVIPTCSLGTNRISWHYHGLLWSDYTYDSGSGNMHRIR